MSDTVKVTASICLCVFGVICALVVGNIYAPASMPQSADQICASSKDARGSAFCLAVIKAAAR